MSKTFFPVYAGFGPFFVAMGSLFPNRDAPYGFFVALPGALMTSAALLIMFRALTTLERTSSTGTPKS